MTMTLAEAERILGVSWRDDLEDVKRKYRRLLMRHHPDRGGRDEVIKPVNEAYERVRLSFGECDLSAALILSPLQAAVKLTLDEGKRFAALMGEPWFSFAESLSPTIAAFWGIRT